MQDHCLRHTLFARIVLHSNHGLQTVQPTQCLLAWQHQ
jgi:hypothetical protein